jgi:preprotein translocase subunit SecF
MIACLMIICQIITDTVEVMQRVLRSFKDENYQKFVEYARLQSKVFGRRYSTTPTTMLTLCPTQRSFLLFFFSFPPHNTQ